MPILDVGHQLIFGPMSKLTICQGHGYLEIRNQRNTQNRTFSQRYPSPTLSSLVFGEHLKKKTTVFFFPKKNMEFTTLQQKKHPQKWHCNLYLAETLNSSSTNGALTIHLTIGTSAMELSDRLWFDSSSGMDGVINW